MSGHKLYDLKHNQQTDNGDQVRLLSNTYSNTTTKLNELKQSLKTAFSLKWNWLLSLWGFCGLLLVNAFNGLILFYFFQSLCIQYSANTQACGSYRI